jgi:hypothetical protein
MIESSSNILGVNVVQTFDHCTTVGLHVCQRYPRELSGITFCRFTQFESSNEKCMSQMRTDSSISLTIQRRY